MDVSGGWMDHLSPVTEERYMVYVLYNPFFRPEGCKDFFLSSDSEIWPSYIINNFFTQLKDIREGGAGLQTCRSSWLVTIKVVFTILKFFVWRRGDYFVAINFTPLPPLFIFTFLYVREEFYGFFTKRKNAFMIFFPLFNYLICHKAISWWAPNLTKFSFVVENHRRQMIVLSTNPTGRRR